MLARAGGYEQLDGAAAAATLVLVVLLPLVALTCTVVGVVLVLRDRSLTPRARAGWVLAVCLASPVALVALLVRRRRAGG